MIALFIWQKFSKIWDGNTYRTVWMTGEKTKRKVLHMAATGYAARLMQYKVKRKAVRVDDLKAWKRARMAAVMISSQSMVTTRDALLSLLLLLLLLL